jgi:hypothetical protein
MLESAGDVLIFVSRIRDAPRAEQKASSENGIDHWIGQVRLGAVMIAPERAYDYSAASRNNRARTLKNSLVY